MAKIWGKFAKKKKDISKRVNGTRPFGHKLTRNTSFVIHTIVGQVMQTAI